MMIENYYNDLTPYYKLIYPDWEASIKRQAAVLDSVIREFFGPAANRILDAACGIGTQSIGLAQLGYAVTASDISPAAIGQARQEAAQRALKIEFSVTDMRQLWSAQQKQFDVVIACDNAIPHLLTDDDILQAFAQFYQCVHAGGGTIITVRDYAQLQCDRSRQQLNPRLVHPTPEGRLIMFDLWEFDGRHYEITTYVVEDNGQPNANTRLIRGGRYYCVEIPLLEQLLQKVGFRDVVTLRDRFFQPLIVAKK